jgi:DNA-binding MarR family transcriptional regulator
MDGAKQIDRYPAFEALIEEVSQLRRGLLDRALRPLGVTVSQSLILARLAERSAESMTQTDLASALSISKVAVGLSLDRLEASGLVQRRSDPVDRRAKRVRLTERGERLLGDARKVAERFNGEIMNGIGSDERLEAVMVLYQIKRRLVSLDSAAIPDAPNRSARQKTSSSLVH